MAIQTAVTTETMPPTSTLKGSGRSGVKEPDTGHTGSAVTGDGLINVEIKPGSGAEPDHVFGTTDVRLRSGLGSKLQSQSRHSPIFKCRSYLNASKFAK